MLFLLQVCLYTGSPMSYGEESYCCRRHETFLAKMEDFHEKFPDRPELSCISEHDSLQANFLNPFVLEVAYLQYKNQYRQGMGSPEYE